ncbi:hypothetical protein, partial [Alloprevotella tannerae]|uniref:hypothetical protein n=1 Tax=Alloprevotella tannerae TaxID=76122 RepID=UPI0028EC6286
MGEKTISGVHFGYSSLRFDLRMFLKDQPLGVVQTNVALNRVKALDALTLLCQKTNPKGLFSARRGFRLIIVVKQCIQGCRN